MVGGVTTPGLTLTPEERERRMKHLKAAVEELRQAGLNAQADAMARMGEAMLQGQPASGRVTGIVLTPAGDAPTVLEAAGRPIAAVRRRQTAPPRWPLPQSRRTRRSARCGSNAAARGADHRARQQASLAQSAAAQRGAEGRPPPRCHARRSPGR